MFGLDFEEGSGAGSDPRALFGARTRKVLEEGTEFHGIVPHLLAAADGCTHLFLWLDCDREGENICFEVLRVLRAEGFFASDESVFRAKFSSLTDVELRRAWQRPGRPNKAESDSVDARQELDLKIGCSFTRFLTRQLRPSARLSFGGDGALRRRGEGEGGGESA